PVLGGLVDCVLLRCSTNWASRDPSRSAARTFRPLMRSMAFLEPRRTVSAPSRCDPPIALTVALPPSNARPLPQAFAPLIDSGDGSLAHLNTKCTKISVTAGIMLTHSRYGMPPTSRNWAPTMLSRPDTPTITEYKI